jgi:glycosyltransferase involved in cell wall biosynthesis
MSERILMVTPYPPLRDGLAQYAVQEVKRLRAAGNDVEVLSPEPSAAHYHLDLLSRRGPLALAKRVAGYDRVIIQYHPSVFFRPPVTPAQRARVAAGLLLAFRRAGNVELRVHEFDVEGVTGGSLDAVLTRAMWRAARRITVHTESQGDQLARAYGVPRDRIEVVEHGAHFEPRTTATRAEARAQLQLPDDAFVFLSIGFIQPHKGFDRAVRAFGDLGARGCRLEIVGSVRTDDHDYQVHLDDLRGLVGATPGVTLHEGYVSDEQFDTWIVAVDALVLPYRLIWSSSVAERAVLFGRPVIATQVGGLAQQMPPGTRLVADDSELVLAMRESAGDETLSAREIVAWPAGDRDRIQSEIRARAAALRAASPEAAAISSVSAPVRRIPPLALPDAVSARPGVSTLKRAVRRITGWQLDPVVGQVNRLRSAVIEALEGDGGPADRR